MNQPLFRVINFALTLVGRLSVYLLKSKSVMNCCTLCLVGSNQINHFCLFLLFLSFNYEFFFCYNEHTAFNIIEPTIQILTFLYLPCLFDVK